jgi:hypothetical protein
VPRSYSSWAAISSSIGVKLGGLAAAVRGPRLLAPDTMGLSALHRLGATMGATAVTLGLDVWLARSLALNVPTTAAWRVARRHLAFVALVLGVVCVGGGGLATALDPAGRNDGCRGVRRRRTWSVDSRGGAGRLVVNVSR